MNAKIRTVMPLAVVMLSLGLFSLDQSTLGQSARGLLGPRGNSAQSASARSAHSNCKELKGIRIDVFDPAAGISSGTITGGGWLNGMCPPHIYLPPVHAELTAARAMYAQVGANGNSELFELVSRRNYNGVKEDFDIKKIGYDVCRAYFHSGSNSCAPSIFGGEASVSSPSNGATLR